MGNTQPWIKSGWYDVFWILSPGIFAVFFAAIYNPHGEVPIWAWVAFVLCIDVAHVYSTIFRTYFNSKEFERRRALYIFLPLCIWVAGIFLYSLGSLIFWRCLAYIAVFHFVRQQYGFLRIYSRNESKTDLSHFHKLDTLLIYLATLYPLIYWHANMPRNYFWFVEGDFVSGLPSFVAVIFWGVYIISLILYFLKEFLVYQKNKTINIPKNLLIFSTAISWYTGIVFFNADLAFTATNEIAHGIPYMALIWAFGNNEWNRGASADYKCFSPRFVPIFLLIVLGLAYMEEGLWAGFVWREHLAVFKPFANFPKIIDSATLTWLIPLLALPQATHYVLDGFIWKLREIGPKYLPSKS